MMDDCHILLNSLQFGERREQIAVTHATHHFHSVLNFSPSWSKIAYQSIAIYSFHAIAQNQSDPLIHSIICFASQVYARIKYTHHLVIENR